MQCIEDSRYTDPAQHSLLFKTETRQMASNNNAHTGTRAKINHAGEVRIEFKYGHVMAFSCYGNFEDIADENE